ncbi:uncharacterized protein prob1 [Tachysurus ichikawai]
MSEDKFLNNVLKYVSHSSISLKEKATELQTTRVDEEEINPALADNSLDDSSSSYCSALCSLSEYSEALGDETQTTCTDPPCENALSETSQSFAVSGQMFGNCSSENTDLWEDPQTKQKNNKGNSQYDLSEKTIYSQNKDSVKIPVLIESKKNSSSPKITILNVNLKNLNSVIADQGSIPTNKPNPTPSDYLKSKINAAQTDTKVLEHKITSSNILPRSLDKYHQENNQKHNDIESEAQPTLQTLYTASFKNAQYKLSTEFNPDSSESIISKFKWEGEEHGIGFGKEQAELSLNTGNRKLPASCTSTLIANKQKSEILPRCYSKRLLTTRNQHQHQSQRSPVSRTLKKQDRQGIGLSTSLPPTPCSSSRQHCSSAHNTKGKFCMATKVVGTTMEVEGLAALEYTRTSCPDNNNNMSACSEASSCECIDVALENHEEVDRNAKTVPKRQIHLKRRDNTESHANKKEIIPSTPNQPRDILQRQHSTPAVFHQGSHRSETKSGQSEQKQLQQKLQKSLSLDETSSKTKMASCIIKNVLSKRMQHEENLHSEDVLDQTFYPIKTDGRANNIDYLTSCAKEECTEINDGNLATVTLLSCYTSSQSPTLKTDSQTMSFIKEHISVSSKVLPKLITKHSFNPLLGGVGRTQFQGSGTEIAAYSETEQEKLSPSKASKQGSKEKLSRDSAKGKAWNLSAVTSGAVGKQATVKTTPEECVNVQAAQKQHYVKDQPIEKQEKPGESKESTQSPSVSAWLACSLDSNMVDNALSQSARCNLEKDQESGKGELRPPGQSVNMGIQSQGKFKAISPVHVVRDMRSLVKNTYSLSFRGPSEEIQGLDFHSFTTAGPHPVISKRKSKLKGHKQGEKLHVPNPTLPLALETVMDLASLDTASRECATKALSVLESNDKFPHTGFTKVSPISADQTNSCGLSNSPEVQDSTTAMSQTNAQRSNTYIKQNTCTSKQIQAHKGTFTNASTNEQSADIRNPECEKPKIFAVHPKQPLTTALLSCLPTERSGQQGSCKLSNQERPSEKDAQQIPGLAAKLQSSAGSPSACMLTVAPAPVFPSYFYNPNVLSYQTISPKMGTVSYVQGPVLLQMAPHNQPATASGPIPLKKSLSVENRLLSQLYTADGYPVQQETSKQMESGDISNKMPSPDTQPCTAFVTTFDDEGKHGGSSILYPEMGGSQHVSNLRHTLLDPETGQCFYVDMPQLPQRKMLFDPETCQYVEVVVPPQTLSSTVMTTPCAVPFSSLHIPTMYTPHCLSYVQTHQWELPPPQP